MRLPRDLSGEALAKKLGELGYVQTRQTGSHARFSRSSPDGDAHVTIPLHKSLRVGTLNSILGDVAEQVGVPKVDLVRRLFG